MGVCLETSLHVLVHTYMFLLFVCLFVLILYVPVNIFSVMSGRSHCFLGITSTFWGVNVSYTGGGGVGIEPSDLSLRSQTYFCDETNRLNAAV